MIQLHTLGDAVIKIGNREVRPTSPTVFAALLYLGVERGQRLSRAALQELLFPETDERSGAHSLRQLLYKLRQLGASVQAEGDVVWLASEDVEDDYSAPAHNGNANGNGNGNGHRGATFLAGYAPQLSRAYDEWLEARRTSIEATQRRALIKYMLARRDAADWISVERIANEVLVGDPFNEEATLALAESTALGGSKSEAVRILERYESETGRADLKLPAAVLRRRISERLPDRRRRALDTPFVGRDAEAEAMRQAVVNLRAGNGGSVVISGEPGIGKSRLLEETSALALLEGVNVHVVRCQPHYTSRPMGVFIEWVPQLMQSRGALGVAPETLEHLTLLTSHRDDRANRPADARDDATRSGTLMAAVRDLVDAVASEAPIFLAVEDAHWADSTSLAELCTLLEKRRSAGLLVVYSTRSLEPLKAVGAVADSTQLLRLKPIAPVSMLEISKQLLSPAMGSQPAGIGEWCAATAGGNPLYLQMLCAHFEDTQRPFTVPPGIRTAIARRIEQLASDSRRILELSALLGQHAALGRLQSMLDLPPKRFVDLVQSLEEGGYLRTNGGAAQLSHDLLRECTLDLVPPLTLQLLHGMVASQLESSFDRTLDSSLMWDCAEHWAASGEKAKALRFLLHCARHVSGIGHAALALELLQRSRPYAQSETEQLDLLEETSRLAATTRRWNVVLEIEAETAKLKDLVQSAEHSEAELRGVEARWVLSFESGRGASKRLLNCARSHKATDAHRIDAAYLAIRFAHDLGDFLLAGEAFDAVKSVLTGSPMLGNCGLLLVVYHTSFGDQGLALTTAETMRCELPSLDVGSQIRLAPNLIVAFSYLGHPDTSLQLAQHYYDVASKLDLPNWRHDFAANCCQTLIRMERFDEAAEWYQRAELIRRSSASLISDFILLAAGVDIAIHAGQRDAAAALLLRLRQLQLGDSNRIKSHLRGVEVRSAQVDKAYQSSAKEIDELKSLLGPAMSLMCSDGIATALVEGLLRLDRQAEALGVIDQAVNHRRELGPLPTDLQRLVTRCQTSPTAVTASQSNS